MDDRKALWLALCDIPGIGPSSARHICGQLGLLPQTLWGDLQMKDKRWLKSWLTAASEERGPLGTEFLRQRRLERKALISLGSLRGIRRRQGLPVRGQRTHSNGRTARRQRN